MLKKWGLKNFKSLYNVDLELAPLTVFTGTNSSGKSSFIQSILLIAQTLRSNNYEDSLALNGAYADLGHFNDIRSFNRHDNGTRKYDPVSISFICDYPTEFLYPIIDDKSFHKACFNIEFDATTKDELHYKREQLSPRIDKIELSLDSIDNNGNIKNLKKCSVSNIVYKYSEHGKRITDVQLNHFWPSVKIASDYSNYQDKTNDDSLYTIFKNYFEYGFKYLGPLRHHDSIYPLSKSLYLDDLGIKGEYTAAKLDSSSDYNVSYIPVKCLYKTGLEKEIIIKPLNLALKYWLNYLCIYGEIKPELTKHGYELKSVAEIYKENDFNVNLSHVGTGVSQVLPILVSCLLAEKESVLIFEQPELHLHPRVQSRLADFFLSMALVGKQCIIETHSEYFIDMLRFRISQSLLKDNIDIKNSIKIFYFDKNELKTIVNEIEINEFGDYNIWPDAFFDERQHISDDILNNINETMFKENSGNYPKNEKIICEENIYEEDIYIDENYKNLKYFLFDGISVLKKSVNDYLEKSGIVDFKFKDGIEWTLNPNLSENVKSVMNKYNVNYSLTSYFEENCRIVTINKRDGNEWFVFSFSGKIPLNYDKKDNTETPNG